jgi:hypothetical protein
MSKSFTFLFLFLSLSVFGQGLQNNGAYLVISPSTSVTISGTDGDFNNKNTATSTTIVNGSLYLSGDFTNSRAFGPASGTVIFNGSATQEIFWTGSGSFNNLTLENTAVGTTDIYLRNDIEINGTGTFNNGIVNYNGGSLIFNNGSSCPNGGSATSFVNTTGVSIVTKKGTDAFIFPTGEVAGSDIVWAPVGIAAPAVSSEIGADYNFIAAPFNYNMCNSLIMHHTSGIEYWVLSSTLSTPHVTLFWKDAVRSQINSPGDLLVGYYNSPCWESKGVTGLIVSGNTGSITSNIAFTNYGRITFGTKLNTNPLPISLIDFSANCVNGIAKILWSTASETNNDFFSIERSLDGINWINIANIPGAGNSNQTNNYTYSDENSIDYYVYYRLKQTDFDGNVKTFSPVSVNCSSSADMEVNVFPNPFKEEIILNINNIDYSNAMVNVFDIIGNKIAERKFDDIQNHALHTTFDLGALAVGMYFIEIRSAGFTKNIKIVKN